MSVSCHAVSLYENIVNEVPETIISVILTVVPGEYLSFIHPDHRLVLNHT